MIRLIRRGTVEELEDIARLALKLWPENDDAEIKVEVQNWLTEDGSTIFIKEADEMVIGFAQVSIRQDYVEGTMSSPVGYLEGIYVEPIHRRMGIASELVEACQGWAKDKGCVEFASDIIIDNEDSYEFHIANGFVEVSRLICFTKTIG